MTEPEFLKALKELCVEPETKKVLVSGFNPRTARDGVKNKLCVWELPRCGEYHTPLTAVLCDRGIFKKGRCPMPSEDAGVLADEIGWDWRRVVAFQRAAFGSDGHDPELRAALEAAMGLRKEVAQ